MKKDEEVDGRGKSRETGRDHEETPVAGRVSVGSRADAQIVEEMSDGGVWRADGRD